MKIRSILVAGGAGFIGSNYVHYLLASTNTKRIVVLDKLTYAGSLDNIRTPLRNGQIEFMQGDIAVEEDVNAAIQNCDAVVNFAAESHNDRALLDPSPFIETNVKGAGILAYAAARNDVKRLVHVSTDEVYGEIHDGSFHESFALRPRSTYPAAKAGGEMMILAAVESFGLEACITRGVNNIGPYQHPEKALPLFVTNALQDMPLPIYGTGHQVRDRMHVLDHCSAIHIALEYGNSGEIYNVGADNECTNEYMVDHILQRLNKPESLKRYIEDRTGHDFRYSVDSTRMRELGWEPQYDLNASLNSSIDWYVENEWWWREARSEEFENYYKEVYQDRLSQADQDDT